LELCCGTPSLGPAPGGRRCVEPRGAVSVELLPIPKTLPIDDFFRTSADVWLVALFGTFLAPVFEELAFRGFLLPSLASAYDWLRGNKHSSNGDPIVAPVVGNDQHWSVAALVVSCALTSIAFALVHADQLAHAWAPLRYCSALAWYSAWCASGPNPWPPAP